MTRGDQFKHIERARVAVLASARGDGIPLHRVEFAVPFVPHNLGLSAWFFYEADDQLRRAESLGWSAALTKAFLRSLRSAEYPEEWLRAVRFFFDSHECVVRDYEGSYFYRLR